MRRYHQQQRTAEVKNLTPRKDKGNVDAVGHNISHREKFSTDRTKRRSGKFYIDNQSAIDSCRRNISRRDQWRSSFPSSLCRALS